MKNWENVNFTIETQPYTAEPQQDETEVKPKFKWNWRINQLALPKSVFMRYEPLQKLGLGKLDPECEWRSHQLANPKLLKLIFTKNQVPNPKIVGTLKKYIENTRNSIYYYYYKKRREIKMKKLAAKLKRKKLKQKAKGPTPAEIEKHRQEYLEHLAQPKRKIEPKPSPKIWRNLDELMSGILRLAQPRTYIVLEPKVLSVSPQALAYKITSYTERLATIVPEHRRYIPPPPPPEPKPRIKVKDMKIVLSERLKSISQPRPRAMKKDDDLKEDPWSIPPNALKYKATPRIIELAKPIERD